MNVHVAKRCLPFTLMVDVIPGTNKQQHLLQIVLFMLGCL